VAAARATDKTPADQGASRADDGGLRPQSVGERLDELRRISVPERDEEARARLARERPRRRKDEEAFEVAVERRLNELRALCALANYLHRDHHRTGSGP
jgi:hypothetical protein